MRLPRAFLRRSAHVPAARRRGTRAAAGRRRRIPRHDAPARPRARGGRAVDPLRLRQPLHARRHAADRRGRARRRRRLGAHADGRAAGARRARRAWRARLHAARRSLRLGPDPRARASRRRRRLARAGAARRPRTARAPPHAGVAPLPGGRRSRGQVPRPGRARASGVPGAAAPARHRPRVGEALGALRSSRSGPPRYEDVSRLARALVAHAPERLLWASNWPHPGHDAKPDDAALLDLLADWAPLAAVRERILVDNPAALYGFREASRGAIATEARDRPRPPLRSPAR
ncbi:MAG: amidohydrolase family protein [Betaproteobacteria bacterium]|nr:amidohydrolase family protein [Betaproteobacteria bacterium]